MHSLNAGNLIENNILSFHAPQILSLFSMTSLLTSYAKVLSTRIVESDCFRMRRAVLYVEGLIRITMDKSAYELLEQRCCKNGEARGAEVQK